MAISARQGPYLVNVSVELLRCLGSASRCPKLAAVGTEEKCAIQVRQILWCTASGMPYFSYLFSAAGCSIGPPDRIKPDKKYVITHHRGDEVLVPIRIINFALNFDCP